MTTRILSRLAPVIPSVSQSGGHRRERQMNDEAGSGFGLPLQRAANRFQALAHTAQPIALRAVDTTSVVGDLQRADVLVALQPYSALLRLRMTNDVRHCLAQGQRQYGLLCRGQRQLVEF